MKDLSVEELLNSLGENETVSSSEQVVYGVSDRSKESFWVRLNDSWIDRQKVPLKEKAYFFHLLAVMLDAGVPMLRALTVLAKKTTHPRFRRVIATLAHQVEDGRHLSESMAKFPTVFEEAEIGVIKSGETIGHVDLMLERLSSQLDRSYDVQLKLKGALMYPAVVVSLLIAATLIVMTFVIPKLQVFFEESGVPLPFLTKIVLGASQITLHYWWLFGVTILLLFLMLSFYANTQSGRIMSDYWKLKIPFVGELLKKGLISKFVRLLGVLTSSGLPVNKGLTILSKSMENTLYELKLAEVVKQVERGEKIAENLATTPFLFPETVTQMLSVGESSATVDRACEKLSNHYEREIEHTIRNMMTVLEPLIIVLVGLAVALLALAILGPVFALSELV
ncbi:MAG: Type II secretion system F domain-containing protein, type IV pilus assembly protein PilC [Candidatus Peregrinibacteria bacterium GW2011_GWE2_39_6]|nr:MAG: Type II secretion system F domain-containing protein, type IV pilus assembly protein PilC [Candidatus Peregrinibacteria bacterium GW2011_GWF2_39_17]KKR24229.1 MAG: Type II secretion system F domain-containing protein, type IV pilus assembly protein PilC [Candidatus Peregrinibacteria bacterium GW2011_GWE2_39_6]HCW32786.1 hypothetical protein [Candidatus Peregrinibacteria bacterium]